MTINRSITRNALIIGSLITAVATLGLWLSPSDPIKTKPKENIILNVSNDSIHIVQSDKENRVVKTPRKKVNKLSTPKKSHDVTPDNKYSKLKSEKTPTQEGDCVVESGDKSPVLCNVGGDVNISY